MKKMMLSCILILFVSSTQAASQTECSIWLCAAGGFGPSECKPPYKAMIKRVKKLKPPLPPFSSCLFSNPSELLAFNGSVMTYKYNYAALMPSVKKCVNKKWGKDPVCIQYKTYPSYYIKNKKCHKGKEGDTNPQGCKSTARYIEIFSDGIQMGETFFW